MLFKKLKNTVHSDDFRRRNPFLKYSKERSFCSSLSSQGHAAKDSKRRIAKRRTAEPKSSLKGGFRLCLNMTALLKLMGLTIIS